MQFPTEMQHHGRIEAGGKSNKLRRVVFSRGGVLSEAWSWGGWPATSDAEAGASTATASRWRRLNSTSRWYTKHVSFSSLSDSDAKSLMSVSTLRNLTILYSLSFWWVFAGTGDFTLLEFPMLQISESFLTTSKSRSHKSLIHQTREPFLLMMKRQVQERVQVREYLEFPFPK